MTSSDNLGPKLLELLGIPDKHVKEFTIHAKAGRVMEVVLNRNVIIRDFPGPTTIKEEVKWYKLVEIEEESGEWEDGLWLEGN